MQCSAEEALSWCLEGKTVQFKRWIVQFKRCIAAEPTSEILAWGRRSWFGLAAPLMTAFSMNHALALFFYCRSKRTLADRSGYSSSRLEAMNTSAKSMKIISQTASILLGSTPMSSIINTLLISSLMCLTWTVTMIWESRSRSLHATCMAWFMHDTSRLQGALRKWYTRIPNEDSSLMLITTARQIQERRLWQMPPSHVQRTPTSSYRHGGSSSRPVRQALLRQMRRPL